MSAAHKTPVERLTRWRRFQEEQATNALREGVHAASAAASALQAATSELESLAGRKSQGMNSGRIDLGLYGQLLAYEGAALEARERKLIEQERCDQQLQTCREAVVAAKSQNKVAAARQGRYLAVANDRDEKRAFDLLADQWIAVRRSRA